MGLVNLLKTYKLLLIGIVVGSTAGYLYFHFVGCVSGTRAITSKPVNSTLYGAVMGGLLFSIFKKEHNKTQNNDTSN